MAFYQTKVANTSFFFTQQVKLAMAVITNKSTATTRLAWFTSNAPASQLITASHGSHAVYQPHS